MKRDDLGVYNAKRDFTISPEPRGDRHKKGKKLSFVVQRHDATRLHFDFRLELDGVLKSWAVPKGPSLSPTEKRLAVEVEDHPYSYGSFEGSIPKGEYGGGHVLIWDHGEWEPNGDRLSPGRDTSLVAHEGLRKGHLSFTLKGEKLRGGFSLIRMRGGKFAKKGDKANWLLLKQDDEFAETDAKRAEVTVPMKPPPLKKIELQLATLSSEIPKQGEWIYEIKLDGYRAVVRLDDGKARIESRNGTDWTAKFPRIRKAIEALPIPNAVFDGEICAVDSAGRTRFQELQNSLSENRDAELQYFIFDLLFVDGADIRDRPLLVRKAMLESILHDQTAPLTYVTHLDSEKEITRLFKTACETGLEGIIAKKRDRPYVAGRGRDWVKVKCIHQQEFVIVGFTAPKGSRGGLGALLLGVMDHGELRYVGKVGTGFSQASLNEIAAKLGKTAKSRASLKGAPRLRDATWVDPTLVCEVAFTEWTRDGALRHPVFLGMREDKSADDVVRERPKKVARSRSKASKATTKGAAAPAVKVSHGDRIVDKKSHTTKIELVRYYENVAPLILPHAERRPIALVRCPEGADHECFFQKRKWVGAPASIHADTAEKQQVLYIEDTAGLLSLVQFGSVEIHGWGSRFPEPSKPDCIVMDLDPDEGLPFKRVVEAALELRELFANLELESFVKTTGGKGLHVVVPIAPHYDFETVKALAHSIASDFVRRKPEGFTDNMSKSKRTGRIFIDYLRNGGGATAVLPYSARSKPGLPVAMPVEWKDLARVDPLEFMVQSTPALLAKRKKDPWARYFEVRQSLPKDLGSKKQKR